jgi:hypothetical protein
MGNSQRNEVRFVLNQEVKAELGKLPEQVASKVKASLRGIEAYPADFGIVLVSGKYEGHKIFIHDGFAMRWEVMFESSETIVHVRELRPRSENDKDYLGALIGTGWIPPNWPSQEEVEILEEADEDEADS